MKKFVTLLVLFCFCFSFVTACSQVESSSQTEDSTSKPGETVNTPVIHQLSGNLLANVTPASVQVREPSDAFLMSQADFALKLFGQSVDPEATGNFMISPTSVMLALALCQNGAAGNTLAQMEQLLGGGMCRDELNEYLYSYVSGLPNSEKCKLMIANAMWLKDVPSFVARPDFLQRAADHFQAVVVKAPMNDSTRQEINAWIRKNTDNMIKDMLKELDEDTMAVLVNTVCFTGKWETDIGDPDIRHMAFTNADGKRRPASMLFQKGTTYIDDDGTLGFVRNLAAEPGQPHYQLVALLPKEGMTPAQYAATLTPEKLLSLTKNQKSASAVLSYLPEFSFDSETNMNTPLQSLGMADAFTDRANFSDLSNLPLCISQVLHKTHIEVSQEGVKAAAATSILIDATAAPRPEPSDSIEIVLNRPFLFMIIDEATGLPLFMGAVNEI